jgi:hypothetical protein
MNTPAPDPFDRALAAYSARERARRIDPPTGFAERATAVVVTRPRWPKWTTGTTAAVGLVLAAVGLVLAAGIGYALWPTPEPPDPELVPLVATPEPTPPNIGDTLSEAGDALAKLSRDTTEKATPPTALFAPVEAVKLPPSKPVSPDVQPAAETLASMPGAAKSGLEPVTGSTRRAINLFLRDTGLKPN